MFLKTFYPELNACIGFMDGSVIGLVSQGKNEDQNSAHNGQKSKHALKFKTIAVTGGLITCALVQLE